jgi:hypothetical protein
VRESSAVVEATAEAAFDVRDDSVSDSCRKSSARLASRWIRFTRSMDCANGLSQRDSTSDSPE